VSSLKSRWAEILVARRVEQVEGEPLVLEAHHRRGDRDAALALDRHPVRARPPPLTLDLGTILPRAEGEPTRIRPERSDPGAENAPAPCAAYNWLRLLMAV
jgi:hypothetical protein